MEKLLTVKEVAEKLRTNVNYVYNLRKAGVLRFIKIGNWKCSEKSLQEFVDKYEGFDISNPFDIKEIRDEEEIQD